MSISEAEQKVSGIKNSGIYVSRGNVIENINSISNTNLVWTSGVETWLKLASKEFGLMELLIVWEKTKVRLWAL